MGLTIENIKYKDLLDDISYRFPRRSIVGIYGENANYLLDIINGDIEDFYGKLELEKDVIDSDFYKNYKTSIALVESTPYFYTTTIADEFKFCLDYRKYHVEDVDKEIRDKLSLVGLEINDLNRSIDTLSSSEKYLLTIAVNLIYRPDVIMFKDVFRGLDHNSKKRILTIINNLKEEKKIIIITSQDMNTLYQVTDEIVLLNGSSIYKSGNTDKIFTSNDLFKEDVVPMPNITKVIYLAKTNKRVKLTYQKDVRDVIKDIYKHV